MVGPQRGKPYGYEPPPLPPSQDLFDDDWPELGEFLVLRPALVMINTFKKNQTYFLLPSYPSAICLPVKIVEKKIKR